MGKRYEFDATVLQSSVFEFQKMGEEDLELLKHYRIKTWDGKDFDEELTLKYCRWVISKNRDMLLMGLGGGSFEIPEMYAFVFSGVVVTIECGGGGDPARVFRRYDDGSYDEEIRVSHIGIPLHLADSVEQILAYAAEALAVEGFQSPHLKRLSVVF